jgi:hypothetical protein
MSDEQTAPGLADLARGCPELAAALAENAQLRAQASQQREALRQMLDRLERFVAGNRVQCEYATIFAKKVLADV